MITKAIFVILVNITKALGAFVFLGILQNTILIFLFIPLCHCFDPLNVFKSNHSQKSPSQYVTSKLPQVRHSATQPSFNTFPGFRSQSSFSKGVYTRHNKDNIGDTKGQEIFSLDSSRFDCQDTCYFCGKYKNQYKNNKKNSIKYKLII